MNESDKVDKTIKPAEPLGKAAVRQKMASEDLTDKPRPNHRGRGRTPAEKREVYARYNERKKIVFEAEERNTEYLVLFLASDGENPEQKKKYYVMGGNSAIIYAYDIAPRIGRKSVVLRPDLDNGHYKFKHGVTSISDLELLTAKLGELGIERMPIKNNDLIVYFRLKRKYEKDEIKALLKVHRDELKEMNKVLYTDVTFPDIHKQVMELRTVVYHKMIKMVRTDREVLQDKILEPVFKISDAYTLMAHGDREIHASGVEMAEALDILMDRVAMLSDLEFWDVATCARVGKIAAGLKNLVVGKMVNRGEEEQDVKKI
ncbi:hypothetical protein IJG27_04785 [Candidatus Saccharibacteria bacterium]|nr:hypothetical protein [Candidatus Saccharibacteria bacterium]